ncbi:MULTISPECIES: metallophosphoesterase [Pseudomonas]|uniref:metallophosphoesterase n=1 Tax=Pseudomonas TaxID=286 RepID=UPI001BE88922|nr:MULTISPECIES: metallophosphoesterase [Pseudomonas]MBT2339075.1 metallophosphoesterase [Pseudomonas fluorescens]MCD4528173.1 metallophosphoesterase [Pseudomonas sp. C3-2018]
MNAIKTFPPNEKGRDFVVGDVHGHFKLLSALLDRSKFDVGRDRLFSVGDLIDRGPDSVEVLDWLSQPWFHAVRGNHEQMLIDCVSGHGDISRHTRNGGAWLYALAPAVQHKLSLALQALPIIIEVPLMDGRKVGIVHAEAPLTQKDDDWQKAKEALSGQLGEICRLRAVSMALYAREKIERQNNDPVKGMDQLYVGHSTVPSVTRLGNVVYTDTGCSFGDGALSLIDLGAGTVTHIAMEP